MMDFNTWRQQAMQNAGRDWNEADAQNQYRMYQLRQEGVGTRGAAQQVGQNLQGATDVTGLRAHSQQYGMGTDRFEDVDDATLQVWKEQAWDTNCPPNTPFQAFDGSGCVEKPIDSNTGRGRTPGQGWQRGGPGGAPGQATGPNAAASGGFNPMDPLQQRLVNMAGQGAGFFGQDGRNNVASLQGGGVWWGQGGDFSQAFNPLAPRGQSRPSGGGGWGAAAQSNPFQAAAGGTGGSIGTPSQPAQPFAPPVNPAVAPQQDWLSSTRRNPMQDKLFQFYGGKQVNR